MNCGERITEKAGWWLGMNSSVGSVGPFCPDITLDPLGHHVMSCMQKWWRCGHQTQSHENLFFFYFSHCAHLSVDVEAGHGLLGVKSTSCLQYMCFLMGGKGQILQLLI